MDDTNSGHKHRQMACKTLKTVLLFLLAFADFTTDWMLFDDFNRAEKGLVFGAPGDAVVYGLLFFSIVGTITFIVEVIILFANSVKDGKYEDLENIVSAVVIWIEDVPQVFISFSVVLCRQDAISGFQVAKAMVVIIGILVRLIALLIKLRHKYQAHKCDSDACRAKLEKSNCPKIMNGVIGILTAGVVIETVFSAVILGMTYIGHDNEGKHVFRVPTDFLQEPVEDQAFLNDVGLFVHHPDLFDMGKTDNDSAVNWLHLDLLFDLKEGDGEHTFNIQYAYALNDTRILAVWMKSGNAVKSQAVWKLSGCYSIEPSIPKITVLPNTSCTTNSVFSGISESIVFKFRYDKPNTNPFQKTRHIGEIYCNVKQWKNGNCSSMEYAEDVDSRQNSPPSLILHYFKINAESVDPETAGHFVNENSTSPRFFRNDGKDMESVSSAVKTGWSKCDYTGSVSPVYDENMEVDCDF